MPLTAPGEPVAAPSAERLDAEGWPLIPPTRITIHRTSAEDIGDRQVILSIDGERIGQLLFGQTMTREIAPGPHVLRAYNTLVWKSIAFEAPPGADLHFTCVNRAPRVWYYLVAILGVGPLLVTLVPGRPGDAGSDLARRPARPPAPGS